MAAQHSFFSLRPCEGAGPFRLFPEASTLLVDEALVESKSGVAASIDLGHVSPEHAGIVIPFVQLPVCITSVDLERRSDGRFAYVRHEGRGAGEGLDGLVKAVATDVKTCVRAHAAPLKSRFGITLGCAAEAVASREYENKEQGVGWCSGPDVYWAQARTRDSHGVPAPAWIYAGLLECAFFRGYHFVFYEPARGLLRQVIEIT